MYGVLMCDLSGSRKLLPERRAEAQGAVREAVEQLARTFPGVVSHAFEFRFGDEWQILVSDHARVYAVYSHLYYLLEPYRFYCGIGIGSLSTPLTANSHEVDGPAFHAARTALEEAKRSHRQVVILPAQTAAADPPAAPPVLSALQAMADLIARQREGRRQSQQDVSRLTIVERLSPSQIAPRLGISRSAVSYRMRSAGVKEEMQAMAAMESLLSSLRMDESGIAAENPA